MSSNKMVSAVVKMDDGTLKEMEVPSNLKAGDDHFLPVNGEEGRFTKVKVFAIVNDGTTDNGSNITSKLSEKWASVKGYFSKWRWYHYIAGFILVTWVFMLLGVILK
jgi:hypothetical protein